MNRTFQVVLGLFVLLVAAVMVVIFRVALPDKQPRPPITIDPLPENAGNGMALPKPATNNPAGGASKTSGAPTPDDEAAREKEREAIRASWQNAMDSNDEERILAESIKLMKHTDPEIRLSAVEGLSWIGAKGVVTLTDMLYDKDPRVMREAADAWMEEMREMNDDETKAEILGNVYDVDSMDEDTLTELLDLFHDLPEHLAAPKLYEMLKESKNPEYQELILDALNFVIQLDEPFDMDNLPQAMREIEAWIAENKNGVVEKEDK